MDWVPEPAGGDGGVSAGFGGGGGVGGMFDCGEPGGGGGIGVVGGGGGAVSVGFEGEVGGLGGVGTSCASRAPEISSEPAARADSSGLREFISRTPCQNAGRGRIAGAAALQAR
jgi:hypothetical protein